MAKSKKEPVLADEAAQADEGETVAIGESTDIVVGVDQSGVETGVYQVQPDGELKKALAYSIVSVGPSFIRAGRHFSKNPTVVTEHEIPLADLTRILGEPQLKVEIVER